MSSPLPNTCRTSRKSLNKFWVKVFRNPCRNNAGFPQSVWDNWSEPCDNKAAFRPLLDQSVWNLTVGSHTNCETGRDTHPCRFSRMRIYYLDVTLSGLYRNAASRKVPEYGCSRLFLPSLHPTRRHLTAWSTPFERDEQHQPGYKNRLCINKPLCAEITIADTSHRRHWHIGFLLNLS